MKGELPGRGSQAEKEAEAYGKQAGAKLDSAVSKATLTYHPFLPCHLPLPLPSRSTTYNCR